MPAEFNIGDVVIYEHRNSNSGRKLTCRISEIQEDWIVDVNSGTHISASFKPSEVIVWEHHRVGKKGR